MESQSEGFKPPYMSFQTFWNFIHELGSKPVPPRIDRSLMNSKSGTDQANLTNALTTFDLIDSTGAVQPRLRELAAADEEGRKAILAAMVRSYYPNAVAVSEANDTEAALNDAFRDEYGLNAAETRRKCVTFFLHALRTADLPVSPHFKQTRPGSGAPGATKARRPNGSNRRKPPAETPKTPPPDDSGSATEGRTRKVELSSGGWVSLAYDFDLFEVSREDQEFVLGIVQMLRDYEANHEGGES